MIYNKKIKGLVKFTNLLIKKGKKSKASSIFLKTLFLLKKKSKKNPINLLYSAINTLTPGVSTRKTVVAGRLYNLPCSISKNKSLYFGCNWLQQSAITSKEAKKFLSLSEKLSAECFKVLKRKGNAILFLKQHNKNVSDNRPFLRFVKRKRTLRLPRKIFLKRRRILFSKRNKKKSSVKFKDSFNFRINESIKIVKDHFHDTKLESKFKAKLDQKFIKIDKKREFKSRSIFGSKKPKIFNPKNFKKKIRKLKPNDKRLRYSNKTFN